MQQEVKLSITTSTGKTADVDDILSAHARSHRAPLCVRARGSGGVHGGLWGVVSGGGGGVDSVSSLFSQLSQAGGSRGYWLYL